MHDWQSSFFFSSQTENAVPRMEDPTEPLYATVRTRKVAASLFPIIGHENTITRKQVVEDLRRYDQYPVLQAKMVNITAAQKKQLPRYEADGYVSVPEIEESRARNNEENRDMPASREQGYIEMQERNDQGYHKKQDQERNDQGYTQMHEGKDMNYQGYQHMLEHKERNDPSYREIQAWKERRDQGYRERKEYEEKIQKIQENETMSEPAFEINTNSPKVSREAENISSEGPNLRQETQDTTNREYMRRFSDTSELSRGSHELRQSTENLQSRSRQQLAFNEQPGEGFDTKRTVVKNPGDVILVDENDKVIPFQFSQSKKLPSANSSDATLYENYPHQKSNNNFSQPYSSRQVIGKNEPGTQGQFKEAGKESKQFRSSTSSDSEVFFPSPSTPAPPVRQDSLQFDLSQHQRQNLPQQNTFTEPVSPPRLSKSFNKNVATEPLTSTPKSKNTQDYSDSSYYHQSSMDRDSTSTEQSVLIDAAFASKEPYLQQVSGQEQQRQGAPEQHQQVQEQQQQQHQQQQQQQQQQQHPLPSRAPIMGTQSTRIKAKSQDPALLAHGVDFHRSKESTLQHAHGVRTQSDPYAGNTRNNSSNDQRSETYSDSNDIRYLPNSQQQQEQQRHQQQQEQQQQQQQPQLSPDPYSTTSDYGSMDRNYGGAVWTSSRNRTTGSQGPLQRRGSGGEYVVIHTSPTQKKVQDIVYNDKGTRSNAIQESDSRSSSFPVIEVL